NRGLLEYDELENVQIQGAPVITFNASQLTIAEGDTLTVDAIIDFAGLPQIGDVEWDLDNDGLFGEPDEISGTSQSITWTELLVAPGIKDDGLYTIAVRATNSVATTTRYRTLTVTNTPPTIVPPSESAAVSGELFTLSLVATDPGDDLVTGWKINWGDTSSVQSLGASATSATHVYQSDGTYTVFIRVFDEDSGVALASVISHTVTVGITDVPNSGPYTINEGDSLTLSASPYGSPVAIGWDLDGGGIDLSSASGTFTWDQLQSLSASPINNSGQYSIEVIATYSDGASGTYDVSSSVDLTVLNVAPTALFANTGPVLEGSDGQSVSVSFSNTFDLAAADVAAGFTYDFFFGDDPTFDLVKVTTPSVYVPAALLAVDGELQVRGVIHDQDGATTEYVTSIAIAEDEPDISMSVANGSPSPLLEGDAFLLDVSIRDQGNEPLDLVVIDWGDSLVESVDLTSQPIPHTFADDGLHTITLGLWSDGIKYTQSLAVAVENTNPSVSALNITSASGDSTVFEGDLFYLTGLLSDPGLSDSLTLSVDWGDNQVDSYSLGIDPQQFKVNHIFTNDGDYTISVTVSDDDLGVSTPVNTLIQVRNSSPHINLTPNRTSILESETLTLEVSIQDPGLQDQFDVTIDWGDGSPVTTLNAVFGSFQIDHVFMDDVPSGTASDQLNIVVMAIDLADSTSKGLAQETVSVTNISPQLNTIDIGDAGNSETPASVNQPINLTGFFTEQGQDDVVVSWINWGDGNTTSGDLHYTDPGGGTLSALHSYLTDGVYLITVGLSDDDGGISDELTATAYVGDVVPPQISDIIFGDGGTQRSIIRSLTVFFDSIVNIEDGAFEIKTRDGVLVDVAVELVEEGEKTKAILTFDGNEVDSSGSLKDGHYVLTILGSRVHDLAANLLDGDRDGLPGGDVTDEFFRFLGDADGDLDVDLFDLALLRRSFGRSAGDSSFNSAFDFDGDNDVDLFDLAIFRRNYGKSL
ncbi:MAG: hypothetical protein KDB03_26625, partial [Planctomycetales bacterium]|nr:hypothetical protein [Planctomycetales bacterium]